MKKLLKINKKLIIKVGDIVTTKKKGKIINLRRDIIVYDDTM